MNKKAIILGVTGTFILLTAAAVYYLVEIKRVSFIMAFITVSSIFWAITAVVMSLFRDKLYNGLNKLSKERKERLLANYIRQYKLYKFMLWGSPLQILAIYLIYKYAPDIELDFINIAIIVAFFYLGAISSVANKRHVISLLKEN